MIWSRCSIGSRERSDTSHFADDGAPSRIIICQVYVIHDVLTELLSISSRITLLVCVWQRRLQGEHIIHGSLSVFLTNLEIFPSSQQAPTEMIYLVRAGNSPEESGHFKLISYAESNNPTVSPGEHQSNGFTQIQDSRCWQILSKKIC